MQFMLISPAKQPNYYKLVQLIVVITIN